MEIKGKQIVVVHAERFFSSPLVGIPGPARAIEQGIEPRKKNSKIIWRVSTNSERGVTKEQAVSSRPGRNCSVGVERSRLDAHIIGSEGGDSMERKKRSPFREKECRGVTGSPFKGYRR